MSSRPATKRQIDFIEQLQERWAWLLEPRYNHPTSQSRDLSARAFKSPLTHNYLDMEAVRRHADADLSVVHDFLALDEDLFARRHRAHYGVDVASLREICGTFVAAVRAASKIEDKTAREAALSAAYDKGLSEWMAWSEGADYQARARQVEALTASTEGLTMDEASQIIDVLK